MGWSKELMCTSAANCLQNKSHYWGRYQTQFGRKVANCLQNKSHYWGRYQTQFGRKVANCLQNKSHYSSFHLHTAVNTNSYWLEYTRTSSNKRSEEGGLSWSLGLRTK